MIVHTHTEYWSFSCDFTNLTNLHYSLEHLTFHCTSFRFFSFFFFFSGGVKMLLLSKWCEKIINISNCSADVKVLYNNKNKKNKQKKKKLKKPPNHWNQKVYVNNQHLSLLETEQGWWGWIRTHWDSATSTVRYWCPPPVHHHGGLTVTQTPAELSMGQYCIDTV